MRDLHSRGRSSVAERDSATPDPAPSTSPSVSAPERGQPTAADPLVRVFKGANPWGWPLSARARELNATPQRGDVVPLSEALTRPWQIDAHSVGYEAVPSRPYGSVRLAEGAEARVTIRMVWLALDVDHPVAKAAKPKRACTPEERAELAAQVEAFRATVPGVVAYHTRAGARLIARLAEPVVVDSPAAAARWKGLVSRVIARAARVGLRADPACVEWQRFFRLPTVRRDGVMQRWPWQGSPEELGCWPELDPSPEAVAEDRATLAATPGLAVLAKHLAPPRPARPPRDPATPRTPRTRDARVTVPLPTGEAAGALAREIAEGVLALPPGTGDRHTARLAVVGALLAYLSPEALAPVIAEAARHTGTDLAEWDFDARVARHARGEPVYGLTDLREMEAVALVSAVQRLAGETQGSRWALELARRGIPELVSADAACGQLAAAMRSAVWPLDGGSRTLLARLTMGAGKSRTSCTVAVEVARAGGRVVVLAPTHAVAGELRAQHLAGQGVRVLSLTSPPSVLDAQGASACAIEGAAMDWAELGRPIVRELCDGRGQAEPPKARGSLPVLPPKGPDDPCVHRETCVAYATHATELDALATEGPGVLVTVHAYAHRAHQWLRERPEGSPGLAVVDEDPAMLRAIVLTHAQILAAAEGVTSSSPYATTPPVAAAASEVLEAVASEVARGATDLSALSPAIVARAAEVGLTKKSALWKPLPVARRLRAAMMRGIRSPKAVALQRAGEVLRAVLREVTGAVVTCGTDYRGDRVLSMAALDGGLYALLADTTLARVVLDATADPGWIAPWLPGARVLDVHVADGAPVERVMVPWAHATKGHCIPDRTHIVWDEVTPVVCDGLALATAGLARGSRVLVTTWRFLREALTGPREALPEAVRSTLDALDARGVTVEWAHYGAVRGRDQWRDVDALLALGGPHPEGRSMEIMTAAARLRGWEGGSRALGLHLSRAELGQVVGRPRLTRLVKPCRVVVVADVLPLDGDARWRVVERVAGAAPVLPADALAAVAHLPVREAAEVLGVGKSTVARARGGLSHITVQKEKALLLHREVGQTPSPPQTCENAGETSEPALEIPTSEGVRLVLGGTSPAEVPPEVWGGIAPPARVEPPSIESADDVVVAAHLAGAPLALRWRDTGDLAVSPTLPPELAAAARAHAPEIALLLGRRTPEDSVGEWPPELAEVYRRAVVQARGALPDHLAERAAAWWAWSGPWPEREVA